MKLLGKKPTIDHDPDEFGQKPVRFWLLRRVICFLLAISAVGTGCWMLSPMVLQWPDRILPGWYSVAALGLIGAGVTWLWTDFIEQSEN